MANIFDSLPALAAPKPSELLDELDRYLSTDPEHVQNPLAWWHERRKMYPTLSRMALDYLSIPGMYQLSIQYVFICLHYMYQQPQLMSNASSVKAGFCFRMSATAFPFNL